MLQRVDGAFSGTRSFLYFPTRSNGDSVCGIEIITPSSQHYRTRGGGYDKNNRLGISKLSTRKLPLELKKQNSHALRYFLESANQNACDWAGKLYPTLL